MFIKIHKVEDEAIMGEWINEEWINPSTIVRINKSTDIRIFSQSIQDEIEEKVNRNRGIVEKHLTEITFLDGSCQRYAESVNNILQHIEEGK